MLIGEKKHPDAGIGGRRNSRVPVDFSLQVEGQTHDGTPFRIDARAVVVSRAGATLVTNSSVIPLPAVRLVTPFGRVFQAEINGVWVDDGDGRQRIGVKLLKPRTWLDDDSPGNVSMR